MPIYESIERMDRRGMSIIESGSTETFVEYLETTKNTICGRYPIILLMSMLEAADKESLISFLHYAQSGRAVDLASSSVSYAAGVVEM
jgi:AmmeMemoRadiSam system protein B